MWQRYSNQIIVGFIVGIIVIAVGFLISTNWVLRLILMTVVLVGETIYVAQFIRTPASSNAIIHQPTPPLPPRQESSQDTFKYRDMFTRGLIVGTVLIGIIFLISTSWVLRVFLMTVVLVGVGAYFLRGLGILGHSGSASYRGGPYVSAPASAKNMPGRRSGSKKKEEKEVVAEQAPSDSVTGGFGPSLQDVQEVEQAQSQDATKADDDSFEDAIPMGPSPADGKPAPPPQAPAPVAMPAPGPASAPPQAPSQPKPRPARDEVIFEETAEEAKAPAEAEPEPEMSVGGDAPASDEDFFGTGVYDDGDIDLEAVEAYRRSLGESAGQDTSVHFSAYYPKEITPNDWQPLHTYIYRKFAESQVVKDAEDKLGEKMASFRQGSGSASQTVAEGATIAVTPYLPGFQFNPPVAIIGFYKDWHRLDFEVRAVDAPVNQAGNGRITFTVEGVIIGDIPLSIFVGEAVSGGSTTHATQKIYQAIFASYSHSDTMIVERVERAFKALGLDYLRDVTTLRSGQNWNDELLNMIDRADVFQLFWSEAAAGSKYVRQEWEHALKLGRESQNFIRPVYWKQPMPSAPAELGHIHFAYQPDLDD